MFVESGETMKELFAENEDTNRIHHFSNHYFYVSHMGAHRPEINGIHHNHIDGCMTKHLGWFYVAATAFYVGFCIYLGVGPVSKNEVRQEA